MKKFIYLLLCLYCVLPRLSGQTAATKLYWVQSSGTAANDQLVRSDLDGSNVTVLASGAANFNNPSRLSVDQARSYIYVVDQPAGTGGIYRFDLTGANRTVVAATSATFTYNDLQVAGNYLYWVQSSGTAANDQLVRSDLDGSNVVILASGAANFSNPVNLAVDLVHQYIFVADQPASTGLGIIRYDLTGGNRTVIASPNSTFQYNDLQVAGNYLYWVQSSGTAANDQLVRSDLDGSNVVILASGAANFSNPVTVTVDAALNYIYVGDQTSTNLGIIRYNLTGGNRTVVQPPAGSVFQYNGLSLNTDYNSPYTTSVSVPVNGTYKAGDNLNFTVNWNTPVTITGSPYIPLTIGAASKNATYLSGSGTSSTVFRYTVAPGDFDNNGISVGSSITLNGGTIIGGGLNASLTLNGAGPTAAVNVDGIAPTVSSINRQNPATQLTNSSTLVWRISFSEPVSNVDVADFSLTATGATTGTIASVSASSGTTIDVTVNSVTGDGTLRLDLKSSGTGITDGAGNAISGGYTSGGNYIFSATLPIAIAGLKAYEKGNGIQIEFVNEAESNVNVYEVEKSIDGTGFTKAGSMLPNANNYSRQLYNWYDANVMQGKHFYRVKSIGMDGEIRYSPIAIVNTSNSRNAFRIFPDPVINNTITVQLNAGKANYNLSIYNQGGQLVFTKDIRHSGGSLTQTIALPSLAAGLYIAEWRNELKKLNQQRLVVQ